jgi:propanol-preferring alcohol dehydrogenase
MYAARYHPGQKNVVEEDVPVPKPGPNEVVLKVLAAGVCHSDLHILDGDFPYPMVFTMGHEVCGELVELGSAVPKEALSVGSVYAVHGPNPCGNCLFCRSGRDNLCDNPNRAPIGLGVDGGYAEFVKVPARNIVRVPKGVTPAAAAVATDAVLTPYHALKTLGGVRAGHTVLVIGLGGLGINGVQVARTLGAHVIASDVRESSMDLAKGLGAHETIPSSALNEILKDRAPDIVADFVGRESTFQQAQTLVKAGGIVLAIGLGTPKVPMSTGRIAASEVRVQGAFWGTSIELREVMDYVGKGIIRPQVETAPLENVGHWLDELRAGHIRSRLALIPKGVARSTA